MGYCNHLGSLEAFISILENEKYHGEQLLNWVLVTNGTGLLSSGEARWTLAWWFGVYRDAQSTACCMSPYCNRRPGGSLGWF